ncbi:hypothetical protein GCM10020219_098220 [Nonomuraea dietziae]
MVAATAPAVAYEPVIIEMRRMIPMPSMDIGILPMNPATTNPLAPGVSTALGTALPLRLSPLFKRPTFTHRLSGQQVIFRAIV